MVDEGMQICKPAGMVGQEEHCSQSCGMTRSTDPPVPTSQKESGPAHLLMEVSDTHP